MTTTLQKGTRYYIEALQIDNNGADHLSVAWTLPDGKTEAPIPGAVLIPFEQADNYQNRSSQKKSKSSVADENDQKTATNVPDMALKTYPNPFVNNLLIECSVPKPGNYIVQVFNMQGVLLKTVFNGKLNAGISKFRYDGTRLSSGVYFCRLISDSKVINQQVTLIR